MIDGNTELIAHIGFPTHAFKAPMIYNPWFEQAGVNAVVVPMACQASDYPGLLRSLFKLGNLRGALITMPHKVSTTHLVDELLPAALIAGACNAVRLGPAGQLQGEMFDGEGFVRGLRNKGLKLQGASALVVGSGGVGLQGVLNGDPKAYSGVLLTLEKAAPTPTNPSKSYLVGPLSFAS